ncbi:MAG: hypothetical protein WDN28_24460 [Chthoniobacter sp.]
MIALAAIAGLVTFSILRAQFQHRAEEFNLADMEKMESATLVYDRNGEMVGKFFLQNRIPVSADQISPMMTRR